ncbi:recombination protein O N-terminal domain-containing protein [Bacillus sp. SL00103]
MLGCRQMLIKSEGIVLRTTDYGETNKIVTAAH